MIPHSVGLLLSWKRATLVFDSSDRLKGIVAGDGDWSWLPVAYGRRVLTVRLQLLCWEWCWQRVGEKVPTPSALDDLAAVGALPRLRLEELEG